MDRYITYRRFNTAGNTKFLSQVLLNFLLIAFSTLMNVITIKISRIEIPATIAVKEGSWTRRPTKLKRIFINPVLIISWEEIL